METKKLIITVLALASLPAVAQMPVPLIDNSTVSSPAAWKAATLAMQAALECRKSIDPADSTLRPLLPKNDSGQWELTPPNGFTVFGLPVQSIAVFIDASGELGSSYTVTVEAPKAEATKAAKIKGQRKTKIGSLGAEQGDRPSLTKITCTVAGTYDESE